jgi:hypothetical protein
MAINEEPVFTDVAVGIPVDHQAESQPMCTPTRKKVGIGCVVFLIIGIVAVVLVLVLDFKEIRAEAVLLV